MQLIKPYTEFIVQNLAYIGILEQIEKCARVCYKSENLISEGTAEQMVAMLLKNQHLAMLEHGTVYLKLTNLNPITGYKYRDNKYSKYVEIRDKEASTPAISKYITTNLRVIVENGWEKDLEFLCEPTKFHEKRICVKFICDRGVSHELVRHRVFSFAQESTRYCNYSKDKFGGELVFIEPLWLESSSKQSKQNFKSTLETCNQSYIYLLQDGWTPQQARSTLPNATKTEVCMTGYLSDWEYFFKLRCDTTAHPQMRELTIPLYNRFINDNLLIKPI